MSGSIRSVNNPIIQVKLKGAQSRQPERLTPSQFSGTGVAVVSLVFTQ
jgi:hypothetical protein